MITYNPPAVPTPKGSYVHAMELPPAARVLLVSGQTPALTDGSVPESTEEQFHVVWKRIGAILTAAGMGYQDIVKVQTFITEADYVGKSSEIRRQFLGDHKPTATLLCVNGLADKRYKVEIEVMAARV